MFEKSDIFASEMRIQDVFHIFCVGDVSVVIYLFTISLFLFVKIRCLLLLLQISTSTIFKHISPIFSFFKQPTWTSRLTPLPPEHNNYKHLRVLLTFLSCKQAHRPEPGRELYTLLVTLSAFYCLYDIVFFVINYLLTEFSLV